MYLGTSVLKRVVKGEDITKHIFTWYLHRQINTHENAAIYIYIFKKSARVNDTSEAINVTKE